MILDAKFLDENSCNFYVRKNYTSWLSRGLFQEYKAESILENESKYLINRLKEENCMYIHWCRKMLLIKLNTHLWFKKRAPRKIDTERNYLNLINSIYKNPAAIMIKVKVLVAQMCLTLNDPMDCSPPGFSVHGILQARIPEWVAILFSRGLS